MYKAGIYIRQFTHTLKRTRRDYTTGTDIVKGTSSIWRIWKSNKDLPWWSKLTVHHVQMYFVSMIPSCMIPQYCPCQHEILYMKILWYIKSREIPWFSLFMTVKILYKTSHQLSKFWGKLCCSSPYSKLWNRELSIQNK